MVLLWVKPGEYSPLGCLIRVSFKHQIITTWGVAGLTLALTEDDVMPLADRWKWVKSQISYEIMGNQHLVGIYCTKPKE